MHRRTGSVRRSRFKTVDKEAMVHMVDKVPYFTPEEEKLPKKLSLEDAFMIAEHSENLQFLSPTSRIKFHEPTTVRLDAKVRDLGCIVSMQRGQLTERFDAAMESMLEYRQLFSQDATSRRYDEEHSKTEHEDAEMTTE